jgi:hypothetical protein
LTANIDMWKHNVFRFGRKRWHKPAEKNSCGGSAEELRYYKARHIGGPNPGKRTLVQALPLDWWKP